MQRHTSHAHAFRPASTRIARTASTRIARTAIALLSAGLAGILSACAEKPAAPKDPPPTAVRTGTVATQDIPLAYSFPATIQSPRTVDINARVPGWLDKQVTPDGARVVAGQVLYQIDPSQYRIALEAAQAKLAQANAQEEVARARLDTANAQRTYAQATYDRNKDLVTSGAVSQERFDQMTAQLAEAKAAVEQANADIASAKANELAATADIKNAELNLSYCTVSSSLNGLMGPSKYFEGSLVGDGGKQLLNTVVQTDPMWAGFSPSANYLPVILANQKAGTLAAKVRLEGAASNPTPSTPLRNDQPAPETEARLVFVDSQVTGTSDTVLMRVEFANPDTIFRPGAYGTVEIGLGTQKDAIVVPEEAVFARQTELFVWRVKSDDTVESLRIDAVAKHLDLIVVAPGALAKGDRIVTEGVGKLKAGQKIREAKAADATPAADPASASAPAKAEGR